MKNFSSRQCLILLTIVLIFAAPALARDPVIGWYYPLNPGASWTYENVDDPFDTYTESVFETFEYEGHPAYKMGRAPDDYVIVYSFRGVVSVYGVVLPEGTFDLDEDLILAEVVDGHVFEECFEGPCEEVIIRIWENIDPTLRSLYGMDSGSTDMLLFAGYNAGVSPNIHNTVVESNLPPEVTPPVGGITNISWYLRGVGLLADWDIDSPTGGVEEKFQLKEYSPVQDLPESPLHLYQNQPNPFNPSTTIAFELPRSGPVDLHVFDARGRLVRTLVTGEVFPSGHSKLVWHGRDDAGEPLGSGVYFSVLVTQSGRETRSMMLVK